jgi:hypothetical protein
MRRRLTGTGSKSYVFIRSPTVDGRQYTGEAWKRIKVLEVVDSKMSVRMADKVN